MQIFFKILKELGIAIVFLLLILGVIAFVFYDKVPIGKEVPESIQYTNIDRSQYDVRGDVEDRANETQTFETSSAQLEEYLTEKIVSPGRFEPFSPVNSVPDVPSEIIQGVTSSGAQSGSSATTGSTANTTGESALE